MGEEDCGAKPQRPDSTATGGRGPDLRPAPDGGQTRRRVRPRGARPFSSSDRAITADPLADHAPAADRPAAAVAKISLDGAVILQTTERRGRRPRAAATRTCDRARRGAVEPACRTGERGPAERAAARGRHQRRDLRSGELPHATHDARAPRGVGYGLPRVAVPGARGPRRLDRPRHAFGCPRPGLRRPWAGRARVFRRPTPHRRAAWRQPGFRRQV